MSTCSKGVSVWFACKLCKSFFLNADDFAYHKKKSHLEEFQNTKFIVFEEQSTPPASPPENWVSFLSPKEETIIHKIISSPPTSASTSNVTNVDCNLRNESIQRHRNKEFIEIDLESNNVFIFNDDDEENYDSDEVSNNHFELNCNFNPNNDTNKAAVSALSTKEKDHLESKIPLTSNESGLTDEQHGKHHPPKIIKSTIKSKLTSLKIGERKIENNSRNYKNILQTVIQPPRNPYVHLKRLNLITIKNAPSPSHSNSTVHFHKNINSDANQDNLNASIGKQPSVADVYQENINESTSTFTSTALRTVRNCKFCSKFFDSTAAEFDIHQHSCHLKRPCDNIICVPCLLKFRSFDELNAHNHSFHSTSILTATPKKIQDHEAESRNYVEVPGKNKIQSDFDLKTSSESNTNDLALSTNHGDHVYNTDFNPAFVGVDMDSVSNFYDVDNKNSFLEEKMSNQTSNDNVQNISVFQEQCFTSESILPDASSGTSTTTSNPIFHKCRFCGKKLKYDLFQEHVELCNNLNSNQEQELNFVHKYNRIPNPTTTKVNLNCDDNRVEVVKTEYVTNGNEYEDTEFPNEGNNNLSFAVEEAMSVANGSSNNSGEMQIPQIRLYCVSCKKQFNSNDAIKEHVRNCHETQEGKRRFVCPHQNCGKTSNYKHNLRTHIQQVHSNARPFKCPHPNCPKSFKIAGSRKRHLKSHTNNYSEPMCDY